MTGTRKDFAPTIHSKDWESADNELVLNKGEAGDGITTGFGGIRILRGTKPDFLIRFTESGQRQPNYWLLNLGTTRRYKPGPQVPFVLTEPR